MRFTTLQSDVVSPVFCPVLPLHCPQLITTHEKRCQWRCDPCGPIHYPTSCRLPPPGTSRTFKMMVSDSKGSGRVIKSEGEREMRTHNVQKEVSHFGEGADEQMPLIYDPFMMYCHIWDSAQVAEDKQTWRTKTLSSEHQQSMQNIHNVFWPKNNQVWNSALTGLCLKTFQHKGLHQFQKKKRKIVLQALSCPVWKCNYISVSIRISTVRCRKPDTSSLSGAKLAFGSVMSELLDSSSAGILPSLFSFLFLPLDLSALISLLQC